jgi:hypothetical protein
MLSLFQSFMVMMMLIVPHDMLWYEQCKHAVLVDDCYIFLILIRLPTPNSFSSGDVIPGWFKIPYYQIIKSTSSFYLYINLFIYIVYINLYIKLLDLASVCVCVWACKTYTYLIFWSSYITGENSRIILFHGNICFTNKKMRWAPHVRGMHTHRTMSMSSGNQNLTRSFIILITFLNL